MKELVQSAKSGKQESLELLYKKTYKKAYCLAVQILKDEDTAWDILQDSYMKAFQNLDSLNEAEKFQGWLDSIVINNSKNYLKKKKPLLFSQMLSEEDSDNQLIFEDENKQFSPEKAIDYSETKRLVQSIIEELPELQRMPIILHYMEEMPVKEIASIMECSEGTVKSRLNYGRKSIKEKVLALEKKGTKLYCQPLIPFLYWLFKEQIVSGTAPGIVAGGATSIISQCGISSGATLTGEIGGSTAIKATVKAVQMKTIAIVTATVTVAGAVGLIALSTKSESEADQPQTTIEASMEEYATTNLIQETTIAVYTDGWIEDDTGWRYQYTAGSYATDTCIIESEEKCYYFDDAGYLMRGWIQDDIGWRWHRGKEGTFFKNTIFYVGEPIPEGVESRQRYYYGEHYSLDEDGYRQTGWIKIGRARRRDEEEWNGESWYYFDENGRMIPDMYKTIWND